MVKPDIIAAIATGPGLAAIGIVRLSGHGLSNWMQQLFGRELLPRYATITNFLDSNMNPVDSGIAIFFPGPHSYTGEDVLELQGHGGAAVVKLVLRRCLELGARLAEPGEFTRRAFLNGKIDLAQAESVADLINASSEAAARAAVRSLNGVFSRAINELNGSLLELRTQVEGMIDFPEDDVAELESESVGGALTTLIDRALELRSQALHGKLLRDGLRVAIVGEPNVGKSTLLNNLAGSDVAIVTEFPGTTRDPIATDITLGGIPVHLVDTAGIRETSDPVEQIGVSRALTTARDADLILHIVDVRSPPNASLQIPKDVSKITVFNKVDLIDAMPGLCESEGHPAIRVSAKTGDGMKELQQLILAQSGWESAEDAGFTANERHIAALADAIAHVELAAKQSKRCDLLAEELRLAHLALGRIIGQITADDLLGEIFSRFCIGK